MVMIYKRLWVGGCAEWPFTVAKKQSFTYALDCGRAIAALCLANDCYNQVGQVQLLYLQLTELFWISINQSNITMGASQI